MGTKTYELTAVCVSDYEENYLEEVNPETMDIHKRFLGGVSTLIKGAGGMTVQSGDSSTFGIPASDDDDAEIIYRERCVGEFKERTGFDVPPVMRLKITVECEVLSQEDSKRMWEANKQKVLDHWARGK